VKSVFHNDWDPIYYSSSHNLAVTPASVTTKISAKTTDTQTNRMQEISTSVTTSSTTIHTDSDPGATNADESGIHRETD
jgi:hypothetical protein